MRKYLVEDATYGVARFKADEGSWKMNWTRPSLPSKFRMEKVDGTRSTNALPMLLLPLPEGPMRPSVSPEFSVTSRS